MDILDGLVISEGIFSSDGIIANEGIGGGLDPVISGDFSALSSGFWQGSYQSLSVPVISTYYRMEEVSISSGDLPDGITDNSDCSFTNDSGETKIIEYTITAAMGVSSDLLGLALGSDSGGGDAVIVSQCAMNRPWNTSFVKNYTTKGTYEWANGVTIFPMYANLTAATDINWGSSKQYFKIIGTA